jgi:putative N6-adenine-specific DNA methylase
MMTKCAPGLARHFACEQFEILSDKSIIKEEKERAYSMINYDSAFEAYASDIDGEVLEIAKQNAERAGVDDRIKFFKADARKIEKLDCRGTIVCNPPYGERLMTEREVERLYRDMGKAFSALAPWQIYILTSAENFQSLYGKRADKIRKLYNGMIPCSLYQYFKNK